MSITYQNKKRKYFPSAQNSLKNIFLKCGYWITEVLILLSCTQANQNTKNEKFHLLNVSIYRNELLNLFRAITEGWETIRR